MAVATGRLGAVSIRAGGVDLGHSRVPEIQRARILAALVEVVRERGLARVTVAHIVARSGVSRRTFYEMFEDRDACFLAAFDETIQRARARVLAQGFTPAGGLPAAKGSWQKRIRVALLAILELLDDEPGLGGLCVVDALGAGPIVVERRENVIQALIDAVDEGRAEARRGLAPTPLTAEGVVGAVLAVLHVRLVHLTRPGLSGSKHPARPAPSHHGPVPPPVQDAQGESFTALASDLMSIIVLPYLGPAAAAREAARPVPPVRRERPVPTLANPLQGLQMRLTYRTVQVLRAIAEQPGASNRQVADAAGIHDQGQISKLLGRLQHLGLVSKDDTTQTPGEANAWQLTPRGRQIQAATGGRPQ